MSSIGTPNHPEPAPTPSHTRRSPSKANSLEQVKVTKRRVLCRIARDVTNLLFLRPDGCGK